MVLYNAAQTRKDLDVSNAHGLECNIIQALFKCSMNMAKCPKTGNISAINQRTILVFHPHIQLLREVTNPSNFTPAHKRPQKTPRLVGVYAVGDTLDLRDIQTSSLRQAVRPSGSRPFSLQLCKHGHHVHLWLGTSLLIWILHS